MGIQKGNKSSVRNSLSWHLALAFCWTEEFSIIDFFRPLDCDCELPNFEKKCMKKCSVQAVNWRMVLSVLIPFQLRHNRINDAKILGILTQANIIENHDGMLLASVAFIKRIISSKRSLEN